MHVCIFACLLGHLRPLAVSLDTITFIYAQRLNVLNIYFSSVVSDREGPLPECSVSVKENWNEDDSS